MIEKRFKHADDYCFCERDGRCSMFKDCWPSGKFGIDLVEDESPPEDPAALSTLKEKR